MSLLCNASQRRSFQDVLPGPREAALFTRPITVQWAPSNFVKRDKTRAAANCAPFILSSSRDGAPDPGEQRRLLAPRFIHAPLCCPVIDAVPNANASGLRYRGNPSTTRAGARTFHAVGFCFGEGYSPSPPISTLTKLFPRQYGQSYSQNFRANCRRNAKLASIRPSFVPFSPRTKTRADLILIAPSPACTQVPN